MVKEIKFEEAQSTLDFKDNVRFGDKVINTLMAQPNVVKVLFVDTTSSAGDWNGAIIMPTIASIKENEIVENNPPYDLIFFECNIEGITIENDCFDRILDYHNDEEIFDKIDEYFEAQSYYDKYDNFMDIEGFRFDDDVEHLNLPKYILPKEFRK
jgi:hypothetical protein